MKRLPNTAMHQSRLHSRCVFHPGSLRPGDGERWDGRDLSQIKPCIIERVAYLTTSIHDMMSSSLPEVGGEASDHFIGPGQGKCQQAELSD